MEQSETVDKVMKNVSQVVDESTAAAIKDVLLQGGNDFITLWHDAMPTKEECNQMIDEVTSQASSELNEEQLAILRGILEDVYLNGKNLAEALDLTEQNLEDIYRIAYNNYNASQYLDARNIFTFLTLLNSEEPRYFFGAGAAYQMLKDYPNAIAFYVCCTALDLLNPLPWYHLADCYMNQNQMLDAAVAFNNVLIRTKTNPIYSKIRSRSQIMIDKIIEESGVIPK